MSASAGFSTRLGKSNPTSRMRPTGGGTDVEIDLGAIGLVGLGGIPSDTSLLRVKSRRDG